MMKAEQIARDIRASVWEAMKTPKDGTSRSPKGGVLDALEPLIQEIAALKAAAQSRPDAGAPTPREEA